MVVYSIMTGGPIMHPDTIVLQAGVAVRFGVDSLRAIDVITINAAKILGVEDRGVPWKSARTRASCCGASSPLWMWVPRSGDPSWMEKLPSEADAGHR